MLQARWHDFAIPLLPVRSPRFWRTFLQSGIRCIATLHISPS